MSYFDILLIRKIKSIYCYAMPTSEISGIFTNREIDITGNIISWFNSVPGFGGKTYYLSFSNETNDELIYGSYTENQFGKTKIQIGSIAIEFAYNLFSMSAPNNGIALRLENEMYKSIKLSYTEADHPERYLNKIFSFDSVTDEGNLFYSTKDGSELVLDYNSYLQKFRLIDNVNEETFDGAPQNDNTLNMLVDAGNAFNDYFQFQYLKKILLSNDYHKRNRRKQNVKP